MFLIQSIKKPFNNFFSFFYKKLDNSQGLGSFTGVFMPSILQMIGLILFMRLGWITGHIGIVKMLIIISMCSAILFLTSLSMTAIVTNMKVGGGGAYYIISRSLGVQFGSAIGILLCMAQTTSIALSISGFSVALQMLLPNIPLLALKACTLVGLVVISYISTNLALKTQLLIFIILILSGISIFLGKGSFVPENLSGTEAIGGLGFWAAFSLFFPATSGIESGMSMSGDLKNPSKSLPIGTITAVIVAYLLYTATAIFLNNAVSSSLLKNNTMIIYHVSRFGFLVILGVWGATLSSALGSVLGAPRTLQAVAKDGILPKFLSKGYGVTNQPRIATIFIACLALLLILQTNINQLLPILTMICLMSYCLINFVAFFESLIQNPSWRPAYKTPWFFSLLGSGACFISMLMINAGATLIVISLVVVLYLLSIRRKIQGNWDDIRYSMLSYVIRGAATKLTSLEKNAKSWRPNILALVKPDLSQENLIYFAHAVNMAKGFLTYGSIFSEKEKQYSLINEVKQTFKEYFKTRDISCFVHINPYDHKYKGMLSIVKNYGLGPIRTNTIIVKQPTVMQEIEEFCEFIHEAYHLKKNVVILKDSENSSVFSKPGKDKSNQKKIYLWWRGQYEGNFEFSLSLAYLLQSSRIWVNSKITIQTIVKSEEARSRALEFFPEYNKILRLSNLSFNPLVDTDEDFYSNVVKYSSDSNITFLGLRIPNENETSEEYAKYYRDVVMKTDKIDNIAYVLAGEKMDFSKIFQ